VIFWLFPNASNNAIYGQPICNENDKDNYKNYGCYDFKKNYHLMIFYVIFCIYFMYSAVQIRHGYPDWKNPSSLTANDNFLSLNLNLIFYNLPFLVELKTVLDWCFTKTSLDIFQWLELSEINVAMYNAYNGNKSYYERKLGERITGFEKRLCGCICTSIMLFFLVGPFLFFSNLRFIANFNPVNDLKIDFSMHITHVNNTNTNLNQKYEFKLFSTDSPMIMYQMKKEEFDSYNYSKWPETKFFEPEQVQVIRMKNSSDKMWAASEDYKALLFNLLDQASRNDSTTPDFLVESVLDYQFNRNLPATAR